MAKPKLKTYLVSAPFMAPVYTVQGTSKREVSEDLARRMGLDRLPKGMKVS